MAVIFEHSDFARYCGASAKNFSLPKIKIVVKCSDKVAKDISGDPLWQQKVVKSVQDCLAGYKAGFAKTVSLIDGEIDACIKKSEDATEDSVAKAAKEEAKECVNDVNGRLERLCNGLQSEATQAAEEGWAAVVKAQKKYASYQLKAAATLAYTGGQLVVSIATTAAAGSVTFGAAAIVGLVGIAQKIVSVGNQIYQLAREAESVLDTLDSSLNTLKGVYASHSGLVAGGREVTANVLNDFFDSPMMASIKSCTESAELADNKINGIVVGSHKVSSALSKLLNEVDKVGAQIKKGIPAPAKQKAGLKILNGYSSKVQSAINDVIAQAERADTAASRLDKLVPLLKAVQAKDSKAVKIISKVASLGIGFGMSIAGAETVLEGVLDEAKDLAKDFVVKNVIDSL